MALSGIGLILLMLRLLLEASKADHDAKWHRPPKTHVRRNHKKTMVLSRYGILVGWILFLISHSLLWSM